MASWVGWKHTPRSVDELSTLGEIEFGSRLRDMSFGDDEIRHAVSGQSFLAPEVPDRCAGQNAAHILDEGVSESPSIKELHRYASLDIGEIELHASTAAAGPSDLHVPRY
ncbi:hypothetical protein PENSPDRAFT_650075 [Peniophora sp. CONT]|nr:hypothetical protein PENSPDRAFT_650075 [Peniophora sp. CONT]